jgi:hypothetical protein
MSKPKFQRKHLLWLLALFAMLGGYKTYQAHIQALTIRPLTSSSGFLTYYYTGKPFNVPAC